MTSCCNQGLFDKKSGTAEIDGKGVVWTSRAEFSSVSIGGGSVDGDAVASRLEGLNHFEISHPLCSGDSWDFCLQAGDVIGFRLEYLDGEADGSFGGTAYVPGFKTDNVPDVPDIVIAAEPTRP